MESNKSEPNSDISQAKPRDTAEKAWGSHNLADLCDEASTGRGKRVSIEPDVYARVEEEARRRGVSPETLIQVWLVERLEQGR